MQTLYHPGPRNVPDNLTAPTPSFKRNVVLAVLGLFLFVGVYTLLMVWFGYEAYVLFNATLNGQVDFEIVAWITIVCLAFMCLFMVKSLFIYQKREGDPGRELKPDDEPLLFDYLYKLADEAGAPRPHKVYLTSGVNASVFYHLSIWNLIFPSKKNLLIGLGLVNVLNIGEFKAVLAHEFGHFAQRSMLLGRYVYTAQQIAQRVVNKRDALDSFVAGLSRIDIRIAWIGWLLSILFWAIRSLIETLFSAVAVAERALSREMEFQADLVAVSLTGSDALIHALSKLRAADEAYHASLSAINDQLKDKKAVEDLFVLQTNYIERMRWILNDESFGRTPERKSGDPASHRVFTTRNVNPPEMWSTHPLDNDREDNAKRTYIHADIDERSSWELFRNPTALRNEVTAELIKTANLETTLISSQESVDAMNAEDYSWSFLHPKYQGAYLSHYSYTNFKKVDELFEHQPEGDFASEYNRLYPERLKELIDQHNELKEEIQSLTVVQHEVLTAEKRVIHHRGERIKRSQIPDVLTELRKDEQTLRTALMDHDKRCRSVHYHAGMELDPALGTYLKMLSRLVHFTEHTSRNLTDITGKFNNTLHVVLADGRVSSSELRQVLDVGTELYRAIKVIWDGGKAIQLDDALQQKIGGKPFTELLEPLQLGLPTEGNINDWVNVVQSWIGLGQFAVGKLRNACLERLLDVEEAVMEAKLNGAPVTLAFLPLKLRASTIR